MKKLLLVLMLVCLLASSALPAGAEVQPAPFVVGHTTRMTGNFLSDLWGTNTADQDVRSLIHDYATIAWAMDGTKQVNLTAVRSMTNRLNADGSKTYTIQLQQDLRYSDGSPITARDYLFSLLLLNAPQLAGLAAAPVHALYIQGMDAYASGQQPSISGLRLLDDYRLSLTLRAEVLPSFSELAYVTLNPLPIQILAPGHAVVEEGQGAKLSAPLTEELLRTTLLDPDTGYLSHPRITTGAYQLVRYDAKAHTSELAINPHYKGNYEGRKPRIPRILFCNVTNTEVPELLRTGQVQLVSSLSDGDIIDQLAAMPGQVTLRGSPRPGSAFLAIACEQPLTQSVTLRRAIAASVDYSLLPRDFLHGHGQPVQGFYGLGQWMLRDGFTPTWPSPFTLNLDQAAALLDQDGWTLNQQGDPYRPGTDSQRYRREGETLQPLTLRMAVVTGNEAARMLADMLQRNLAANGAALTIVPMDLAGQLRQHYRQEERQIDLYFLGINFSYLFDPYATYHVDDAYQGIFNTSGLRDQQLMKLAQALQRTAPNQQRQYMDNWQRFQQRWAEMVPLIPLYSNTYYDAHTPALQNYNPLPYWSWGLALLYATWAP